MTQDVLVERHNGIQKITLNRPHKKNALTPEMNAAVADALASGEADRAVRVHVISGSGDSYCAGNDIGDFMKQNAGTADDAAVSRMIATFPLLEKPIIAAVGGVAVGVGATMLLHCDLVYASPAAVFSFPFLNLALVPEAGSSLLLPAMVGRHRAAALFLLGERMGAEEALKLGFVNEIVPQADLVTHAIAKAAILAAKPPGATKLVKMLLHGEAQPVINRMLEEGAHFRAQLKTDEAREAFSAFLEKRPADFSRFG
ncbi:MAG TPA: enoyl-CoA hydratase [Alphaproteobacteria bacterium]|nr:enoyl-CoA hydratase [Alphaproteobacteria bacterium]HAJ46308.1 enoyl-CoA hydratase [Alphaproteobacteria bacterium]